MQHLLAEGQPIGATQSAAYETMAKQLERFDTLARSQAAIRDGVKKVGAKVDKIDAMATAFNTELQHV